MLGLDHNLSGHIRVVQGIGPVTGTGSYQNSGWIDRSQYAAAVAFVLFNTSGGVTGGAVKFRVEDALDSSGTGAAVFLAEQTVSIPAGPNASGVGQANVDLRGARQFVRIGVDSDPTGGTPASIIAGGLVLGQPMRRPAP